MSFEATSESTHCRVPQSTHRTSDFCFEDHSHTDAFTVKDVRGHDGFDRVTDRVTEIDEVPKSSFFLVDGNDVGFRRDRTSDDGEEEGLSGGARFEGTTGEGFAGRVASDCGVNVGDSGFEFREFFFVPDRGGLQRVDRFVVSLRSVHDKKIVGGSP